MVELVPYPEKKQCRGGEEVNKMKLFKSLITYLFIFIIVFLLASCATQLKVAVEKFSIVALADPRWDHETFENALNEVRNHNALGNISPAKFILLCGDYDPFAKNVEKFRSVFEDIKDKPLLLPVIGNHDLQESDFHEAVKWVENLKYAKRRDDKLNYYVDYKNVRIISVNSYHLYDNDLGKWGCLNSKAIEWINSVISSATHVDHVFVAMHEPSFPRHRHVGDSFDECKEDRDAFWDMLVSHYRKVKAILVGHTHYYYRMRIKDPRSAEANNPSEYPDQEGGVYQIDCGACGNGNRNTVVNIEIKGKDILFKVVDADDGPDEKFDVIDEWVLISKH